MFLICSKRQISQYERELLCVVDSQQLGVASLTCTDHKVSATYFHLTQLPAVFLAGAAPSIAFYLSSLEAYFHLTQLPAVFLAGAAPSIAFT